MVGLLYPDDGDILVHGESVPNMADDDLFEMRKKFGVLFQDSTLFGSMNLFDNVCFPLRQHTDKGEEEIREIVSVTGLRLGEVEGDAELAGVHVVEQRRVLHARHVAVQRHKPPPPRQLGHRLDLHDGGAVVGQAPPRIRARAIDQLRMTT